MRLLALQHIACEPPGVYEDVLRERGAEIVRVELDEGDALPSWRDFDAIVLAGGATAPRDLPVSGRELKGIHFAMEYLTESNKRGEGDRVPGLDDEQAISAKGKHVALKVFPRKLAGDEALRRRVLRLAALRASGPLVRTRIETLPVPDDQLSAGEVRPQQDLLPWLHSPCAPKGRHSIRGDRSPRRAGAWLHNQTLKT